MILSEILKEGGVYCMPRASGDDPKANKHAYHAVRYAPRKRG